MGYSVWDAHIDIAVAHIVELMMADWVYEPVMGGHSKPAQREHILAWLEAPLDGQSKASKVFINGTWVSPQNKLHELKLRYSAASGEKKAELAGQIAAERIRMKKAGQEQL